MYIQYIVIAILASIFITPAYSAVDASQLKKKKQTTLGLYMTAKDAGNYMLVNSKKTLFVDIRTRGEINFLGMPIVADANVPYMRMNEWYSWNEKKSSFKLEVNSDFSKAIASRLNEKGLKKSDTVILMCRSGSRSAKAVNLLASLGYNKVYTIVDGYEGGKVKSGLFKGQRKKSGWKNSNLPWTYKLDKNKMYLSKN